MIDISQIVSNTANAAKAAAGASGAAESARRATGDTSGFGDALTRARESSPQQTPATRARDAGAGQDKSASRKQAVPEQARADTGKPQAAPAGKPATADKAKDDDDSTTTAGSAEAAAAAALALLLPATAPATASSAAAGSAVDAGGNAALQAALAGATQPTAADAADAADVAGAPALAQQRDTAALPDTLQAITAEARPAQPSVADTLATIASQRAAMQGSTPSATEARSAAALAQSIPAAGMPAQQDNAGQQPDSGVGQHRADPLAAANGTGGTNEARPAAASFAAAQAAARAGEPTTATISADDAPALAATLASQHTAQAPAAAAAARPVVAPALYDSQWPQALGQQMIRLGMQGSQSAELQLNPPDLGPLKVVLNVVNDQAQAQFVSPHQAVRAAVEAALPHLRTALSENGIQLGQTSIGADGFAGQAGNGQQQQQAPGNGRSQAAFGAGTLASVETGASAEPVVRSTRVLARGEIDTFA